MAYTVGFTGHRPNRLGNVSMMNGKLRALATEYLQKNLVEAVIVGMAPGWDLAAGEAAVDRGLHITAAVPFKGYEICLPEHERERYFHLLDQCDVVKYVCDPGRDPEKLFRRNRWIVVHSDRICALHSGAMSGTSNCVNYAKRVGKPIDNLWDQWRSLHMEEPS